VAVGRNPGSAWQDPCSAGLQTLNGGLKGCCLRNTLSLHVVAAAAAAQAHKCPQLAQMQLKLLGPAAVGMCCQKVGK
jgi:hypothetical protein